jgi:hypothetical protein
MKSASLPSVAIASTMRSTLTLQRALSCAKGERQSGQILLRSCPMHCGFQNCKKVQQCVGMLPSLPAPLTAAHLPFHKMCEGTAGREVSPSDLLRLRTGSGRYCRPAPSRRPPSVSLSPLSTQQTLCLCHRQLQTRRVTAFLFKPSGKYPTGVLTRQHHTMSCSQVYGFTPRCKRKPHT